MLTQYPEFFMKFLWHALVEITERHYSGSYWFDSFPALRQRVILGAWSDLLDSTAPLSSPGFTFFEIRSTYYPFEHTITPEESMQ